MTSVTFSIVLADVSTHVSTSCKPLQGLISREGGERAAPRQPVGRAHLELVHDRHDLLLEVLVGHLTAAEVDLVPAEDDGHLRIARVASERPAVSVVWARLTLTPCCLMYGSHHADSRSNDAGWSML
jgi:hypothetical protein